MKDMFAVFPAEVVTSSSRVCNPKENSEYNKVLESWPVWKHHDVMVQSLEKCPKICSAINVQSLYATPSRRHSTEDTPSSLLQL